MLLINPPVAKPCEPPAGIARLAGTLRGQGIPCTLLDASLEALLVSLADPPAAKDTWGRRACRHVAANLAALRDPAVYCSPDRYRRAAVDLNRVLELAGAAHGVDFGLVNFQNPACSPQKSADLLAAGAQPAANLFYPYFSRRLPQILEETAPPLVGFSLNYLSQAEATFAMAGFLKKIAPQLPIVLGGGLVTSWLGNPSFKNTFAGLIDHLVAGPGEEALLRLLGRNATGEHPPDYAGLPLAGYLSPGFVLPYAASSGCYWNRCSFCPERAEGNPYLALPVDRVTGEVAGLIERHRPVLLHLLDNAVSPALLRGLAEKPPGVDWYGFARVSPLLADPEFCRELRKSGCRMLKLGLESGSQQVLDRLDKGIDLGLVGRVLQALRAAGIATYVYLLFGTPPETEAEARATLDFTVCHREAITFLNLAIFNLPLGAPEAKTLASSGLYEGDLSLYADFVHPAGWQRSRVRRFLDREFKRHPAVAVILRRDPPLFTSNHAPFFRSDTPVV